MNFNFSSNNNECNQRKKNNSEFNCGDYNMDCNPCYRYCYVLGPTGPTGSQGIQGEIGPTGATEPSGEMLNYADFYALMPPDNAATVALGTDVSFPQDGPSSGLSITRTGVSSFNLSEIGTYQIYFNVPVS